MHLCNEMFLSLCKMFGTVNHDVLCLVPRLQVNNLEHVMNSARLKTPFPSSIDHIYCIFLPYSARQYIQRQTDR